MSTTTKTKVHEKYVTRGNAGLASWHLLLRRVTFGSALALMAASYVALHWALDLVVGNAVVAYVVPLFMEAGMAATASAATTIRKHTDGPGPGGYYYSLWVIFSFLMALAQAANIGHAIVTVEPRLTALPSFVPAAVVYGFAAGFAALFPLGGTLFVHVSGFLRAHSVDARWIDDDAKTVRVATDDDARTPAPASVRPARARATRTAQPAPERAHTPEQPVPDVQPERAPSPAPTPQARPVKVDEVDEDGYRRYAADRDLGREWLMAEVADAVGVSPSQGSRRRSRWRDRYEQESRGARPDLLLTDAANDDEDLQATG